MSIFKFDFLFFLSFLKEKINYFQTFARGSMNLKIVLGII